MSLFERSSVHLRPGETVIKLGRCDGKVPGGEALGVKLSLPSGKDKIKWENKIKGEMVLTNNRLLIVGERGRLNSQEANSGKKDLFRKRKGKYDII